VQMPGGLSQVVYRKNDSGGTECIALIILFSEKQF
jgi:hypothetical protein